MSTSNLQLLSTAVGYKAHAVVTVGQGVVKRQVLIKFIAEVYDPEGTGFWAQVHEGDSKLIDQLIESQETVTVGLCSGGAKIFFESVLMSKRRQNLVQRQILLRLPDKAEVVEQRNSPREWVPERMRLTASLLVLGPHGQEAGRFPATLWDLGRDGASIIVPADPSLKKLKNDAGLKLEIQRPDPVLHIGFAAKCRHTDAISDEKIRLGIQFVHDKSNKAEHDLLAGVVEELRKEGIRDSMIGALNHPTSGREHLRRPA
jgi:hypothetical protein